MAMPGRKFSASGEYRYGFNGKENDKDISEGAQDYGMRVYDARIGKFLSVDPLTPKYPELTPYQFASNTPLQAIDLDGAEAIRVGDDTKYGRFVSGQRIEEFSPQNITKIQQNYSDLIGPWRDLLTYKTTKEVMSQARSRVQSIMRQPFEDGHGIIVNFDYYSVDISELPTGKNKESLFEYIRLNFGDFKTNGGSTFAAYNSTERKKWESQDPTSAVMSFDVSLEGANAEDMSVVTSVKAKDYWIFTPVWTLGDGGHPLAGNRQFGITANEGPNGTTYTFFTRGVDRAYGYADLFAQYVILEGAQKLWNAVMKNIADYINNNGGKATVGSKVVSEYSYDGGVVKDELPDE